MNKNLLLASLNLSVEQTLALLDKSEEEIKKLPQYSNINYLKFENAYNSYLSFSFYQDDEYPQSLKESIKSPYSINYLGSIEKLKNPIALLGDYKSNPKDMKIAFNFALDMLKNNVPIICGTGFGIEKAIQECGIYSKIPIFAVENRGILSCKKRTYTSVLLSGGAVISLCDPYEEWSINANKKKAYLIQALSSAIIVLPTNNYYTVLDIVKDAIDLGKDVFVHKEALGSKIGLKLALEGAPIIDGSGHFLDYFEIQRESIVLEKDDGDIYFNGNRFKEFKLN